MVWNMVKEIRAFKGSIMRLIATSDTHTYVNVNDIPEGDVFIHAGDLMTTGYLDDWYEQLEWLNALEHKIKIFVPGNHDFHLQNYPGPALQDMRKIGVTVLGYPGNENYETYTLPNGCTIGGCSYVSGLGNRWAFGENTFKYFDCDPKKMINRVISGCDIVVTHAPFYGILDTSLRNGKSAGEIMFKTTLDLLLDSENTRISTIIHGHIHEQYGHVTYRGVDIFNVTMCDINPAIS